MELLSAYFTLRTHLVLLHLVCFQLELEQLLSADLALGPVKVRMLKILMDEERRRQEFFPAYFTVDSAILLRNFIFSSFSFQVFEILWAQVLQLGMQLSVAHLCVIVIVLGMRRLGLYFLLWVS